MVPCDHGDLEHVYAGSEAAKVDLALDFVDAAAVLVFGWSVPNVGDQGELPRSLPELFVPQVPLTLETLGIIGPTAFAMALVIFAVGVWWLLSGNGPQGPGGNDPRYAVPDVDVSAPSEPVEADSDPEPTVPGAVRIDGGGGVPSTKGVL